MKTKTNKPNGVVLYQGPSVLTGEPIVAIATIKSNNVKTGNMIQTWIMRADQSPLDAVKAKADGAVCGSCPHRRSLGGACYVNVGQAPHGIWKAWKRGSYPTMSDETLGLFKGRTVRFGAYGDPAAVPYEIWESIAAVAEGWTGYTHQLHHKRFDPRILKLCMVSADTPKAALSAHSQGFRTFRVKVQGAPLLPGEIECLSETDGMACKDCRLCNGNGRYAHINNSSVAITVHGPIKGRYTAKYAAAHA